MSFCECYLEGRFVYHIHISTRNGTQYCAVLHSAQVDGACLTRQIATKLYSYLFNRYNTEIESPVLVEIIQTGKIEKFPIPSWAWLQPLNECSGSLADPSKRRLTFSLKFGGYMVDRETVMPTRLIPISQNQLPHEMVKSRAEVEKSIPSDSAQSEGNIGSGAIKLPDMLSFLIIELIGDSVTIRGGKGTTLNLEQVDVFVCPCEFCFLVLHRSHRRKNIKYKSLRQPALNDTR